MKYKNIPIKSITNSNWTTIDWILGNYCNFKCSYCFEGLNSGSIRPPKLNDQIKNNILHLITQLRHVNKQNLIFNLTGGEPTMYHDFENLIEFLKKYGKIKIITNGSRTLNWWNNNVDKLDAAIISYHSEYSDFDHIVSVSKILVNKIRLSIHILINDKLFEKSKDAALKFKEIFNDSNLNIELKLIRNNIGTSITYNQPQLEFIKNFKNQFIKNSPHISSNINFYNNTSVKFQAKFLSDLTGNFKNYKCYAHHEFIQIDQYGNLGKMSCGESYSKLGNIYLSNFIDNYNILEKNIVCSNNTICGCLGLLFATKYSQDE